MCFGNLVPFSHTRETTLFKIFDSIRSGRSDVGLIMIYCTAVDARMAPFHATITTYKYSEIDIINSAIIRQDHRLVVEEQRRERHLDRDLVHTDAYVQQDIPPKLRGIEHVRYLPRQDLDRSA